MLKSSSLPPSMARRERVKSACTHLQDVAPSKDEDESVTPATTMSDRTRSAMTSILSSRGNNLAAILRCQASRYGLIFNEKDTWPRILYLFIYLYPRLGKVDFKILETQLRKQMVWEHKNELWTILEIVVSIN